jgi:aminodeoxyfutalosine synthase
MTATMDFDGLMARVSAGERLGAEDIRQLASTPDILSLGMLADALRRRLHDARVTFVRLATCPFDGSFSDAMPPAAREIRIGGTPDSLTSAVAAVARAKSVAGERVVSGFSWATIEALAEGGTTVSRVLRSLHEAGLEAIGELALDAVDDLDLALERLVGAGYRQVRLTIDKAPASERVALLIRASESQERFGCIQAINPLPMALDGLRPTTGYDDVKMVAIARLAAPNIAAVQVDWLRYGPKLAQVALIFGADDIDGVTSSDAAPDGRRRAPIEEVRRNIEAAGLTPVERDGRFQAV